MALEFLKMIREAFPKKDYDFWQEGIEFFGIRKKYARKGKNLEDIKIIVESNSKNLEYTLSVATSEGTLSSKGSPLINFPKGKHVISFMPLRYDGELEARVGLSWRGNHNLTEQERKVYLSILQSYFEES